MRLAGIDVAHGIIFYISNARRLFKKACSVHMTNKGISESYDSRKEYTFDIT